jgi:hypothetical protein
MKNTKIATITAMVFTLFIGGACKKTVYQTVNQVYSATYTIKTTDWAVDKTTGIFEYKVDLGVPEIDDKIMLDGGVAVYLSFDGGKTYDAVPETVLGVSYGALHSKGVLTVGYANVDGSPADLPGASVYAKVVLLDGVHLD